MPLPKIEVIINKVLSIIPIKIRGASGYDADTNSSSELKVAASVTASALPTGAATAALQTALNALITATNVLLTTIDADTGTIKTNTDPLVASGAGGYVRQDSTGTIAKESGGNLASVKTNTDPLVTSGGGGYVRQDSTGTIAKETGGNLATLAGKDFATETTLALAETHLGNIDASTASPTTINEYNVTLTNADTQYSQALPSATRAIEFRNRAAYDLRYAFTDAKVATPVAPYFTVKSGETYYKDFVNLTSKTLYLASAHAGDVVELIAWS
jgi:hypothetical protein